ncbi:MAG: hypothetical protein RLY16_1010, partial [Bacteroidota bacterium]
MKFVCSFLLIHVFASTILFAQSGRIGIGTSSPLARLHVADSNVLFSAVGPATPSFLPTPIDGAGRRMMWYVDKAAFRVGYVDGSNWHQDSIGFYSIAGGFDCKAIGFGSVAFGNNNMANSAGAVAMGDNNVANGVNSVALGFRNYAGGTHSFVVGELNIADQAASNSFVSGIGNIARGFSSVAFGGSTAANGNLSIALNYGTQSNGLNATAAGNLTIANGNHSFVVGTMNDTLVSKGYDGYSFDNPLFIVGNGDDLQGVHRSNALVVYKSGNTHHNGYTRLGTAQENAPLIKIKEIGNAVSAATEGGVTTIPHGLARFNIISLTALLVYGSGDVVAGFRGTPGYEFSVAFDDVNIYLYNIAG